MNELTVKAVTEELPHVLEFVNKQLDECGCPPRIQLQIEVAVEELFVNIAHYAYSPEIGHATVQVTVIDDPFSVEIAFIDKGIPYDPLSRPDPDIRLSAEERKIGGLGIFMVKNSMDDIQYEYKDGRNILTIKKNM